MTDTTVAPPAGGASEVAINPEPVASPTPVGQQAPSKPVGPDFKGSEHRAESRREAIQKAYERASNPPPKPERHAEKPAPVADAKPGHNNPPEPTEKLDLKKRPAEQPRGDRGQFAPRQQNPQPDQQRVPQGQRAPHKQLPEGTPYRAPPPRMADHAKAEWHAAPESVRGEVYRMAQEFDAAHRYYRGDHETMNSIRQFHDMATQHGTTLQKALTNYVSMEQRLRQDPVGGLDVIVNNLNLRSPNGQKLTFRDIAYHVLSQSPEQLRTMQTANAQGAQSHQIGALHQQIAGLQQHLHQMHTAQQFTYTRSAVDQYAATHPRFDELGDIIEDELKRGFDLDTAYRRAELLRPGTHAAQTRSTTHAAQTRTPSAQTRPADKSIHGAPDSPSNGTSRSEKPVGRREAIQSAIRRVNGGL
jgi:hypothetical protein